jgi:hypothetical protein
MTTAATITTAQATTNSNLNMWGAIPHDRQSPGVGIQATARYIHVHGNPTIHYLVRLQQLLLRLPQHDKSCVLQGSESSWTVIHNQ